MELGNLNKAILNPKLAIILRVKSSLNKLCFATNMFVQSGVLVLRETVHLIILARSSSK